MRLKLWKTKPMTPFRISVRSFSLSVLTSFPFSMYEPSVGLSSSPRMFSRVDLPQPDGPMMATNSPAFTSRFTSRSAHVSTSSVRNIFLMFSNCIIDCCL